MLKKTTNTIYLILANDKSQLFQFSFLMLFVELTIIRWTGSNIYLISFFTNFVLLASFLGIGLGFLRLKSSVSLFNLSPIILMLVVAVCYYYSYEYRVQVIPSTDNINLYFSYFKNNAYPIWLTLPVIFIMVMLLMTTIADGVARAFQKFMPLQAYRLEVLGSLTGIIAFSLMSYLHTPPLYWGIIISIIYVPLLVTQRQSRNFLVVLLMLINLSALIVMIVIFKKESIVTDYLWSPYYKIALQKYSDSRYVVNINSMPQQIIESVEQQLALR